MKNKTWISLLILLLTVSMGTMSLTYAAGTAEKQNELNSVNQQKQETKNDMESLVDDIEAQQKEVDKIQAELGQKQAEVEKNLAELKEIQADIEKRKDGLNARLRAMYKNGSIGYLDIVLGSGSLSELLSNVEMIQRIYKSDQKTLTTLETQHKEVEQKQAALEEEKKAISKQKAVADAKNAELNGRKDELQAKLDSLNADAERIGGEIAAMQKAAAAAAQAASAASGGGGSAPTFTGGQFIWPTTSHLLTSPFGYRIHPITGRWTGHTGVDIGVGMRSPVYAAASGTVLLSSRYGGYGNAVVIDHGGGFSTLYGHNDALLVSAGQTVSQGQLIAYSGNTGNSTGPHLHFEVRKGGTPVDPMQYF